MMTSGLSGAMSSSQARFGSGRPDCSSASQPFQVGAGLSPFRDFVADRRDNFVGSGDGDGPDVDDAVRQRDRLHQRMTVRLDESRHYAAVADIDGLGVGADEALDVGPVAHRDDAAIGYGKRLRRGPGLIDGQHGSGDDDICGGHGVEW